MPKPGTGKGQTVRARLDDVSAKLRAKVKTLRGVVLKVGGDYGIVRKRVAERAGDVMRLFAAVANEMAEKDLPFTMADFARMFDPSVPFFAGDKDNPGYAVNNTYVALVYMKRVRDLATRRKGARGVTDPATNQLGRMIATFATFVKPESMPLLYEAIKSEVGLDDAAIKRLIKRAEACAPFYDLSQKIKPISLDGLKITHQASIKGAASSSVTEHPATKAMREAAATVAARQGVASGAADLRRKRAAA